MVQTTNINPLVFDIVKTAGPLSDDEVTFLIGKLLESHSLAINPQIVVQVQKLQTNKSVKTNDESKEASQENKAE